MLHVPVQMYHDAQTCKQKYIWQFKVTFKVHETHCDKKGVLSFIFLKTSTIFASTVAPTEIGNEPNIRA